MFGMRSMLRRISGLALAALLAACSTVPPMAAPADAAPLLRLAPAALGRTLALQQQLTVSAREQTHRLDVILEADADAVRLALMNLGQTVARLEWDGVKLNETRASWWPAAIKSERILSDLQLVLWPAAAISAALPEGWSLDSSAAQRVLRQRGEVVITVSYTTPTHADLAHLRDGYRLGIESRSLLGGAS